MPTRRIVGRTLFPFRTRFGFLLIILPIFGLGACSTPAPNEEYTLARTAISAAKDVDSARYAPSYWHRAEDSYRKGEGHYRNQEFEEALMEFQQAREYAERAENVTRVQKFKSGEVVP